MPESYRAFFDTQTKSGWSIEALTIASQTRLVA